MYLSERDKVKNKRIKGGGECIRVSPLPKSGFLIEQTKGKKVRTCYFVLFSQGMKEKLVLSDRTTVLMKAERTKERDK